ncbi:hypothetical protein KJ854_05830 [Patescibacteria group bacterium]|nr:hypothetical protein [Patescibacteria group bacterium]
MVISDIKNSFTTSNAVIKTTKNTFMIEIFLIMPPNRLGVFKNYMLIIPKDKNNGKG